MTLSPLELLSVLLLPGLLGAALLRLLGVGLRTDPLAYIGWAWCQGALGISYVLSVWLWLGLPLRASWLAPVLLCLAGVAALFARRVPLAEPSVSERDFPRWERLCFAAVLGFLLILAADRILLASNKAVAGGDEALIWAAKAKVMLASGGFGSDFNALMHTPRLVEHGDYPTLNPLLQLWVYTHAGEVVHVENRLPIQMFGLAFLLLLASALRRRARPLVAALFLACLGTIGFFKLSMSQAYSDLLIAVGLLACWDLWQRYEEDGEQLWLRLLGLTTPLLVWSKNEGWMLVFVFGLAFLLAGWARRVRLPEREYLARCLAWGLPLFASLAYLSWFNRHFDLVNDLVSAGSSDPSVSHGFVARFLENGFQRAGTIVAFFANLIAGPSSHYLLLAFLGLVVLAPKNAFGRGRMTFTLGIALALSGYMAVYLGTYWELTRHLETSAHRLIFQLSPAAGLWVLIQVVDALPGLSAGGVRGEARGALLLNPVRAREHAA